MSVSSVLSQISPPIAAPAPTGNDTVSKDDFLKLLVTQLQKQDPLNPQDPTEFTSQLTQFSSLEQLMQVNTSIQGLATQQSLSSQLGTAGYIGRTGTVQGDSVTVAGGVASPLHYNMPSTSAKTSLTIYDSNGNSVQTVDLGAQTAGAHDYTWPGTNSSGAPVGDGNYHMVMTAEDAAQASITPDMSVTGPITSIQFQNGQTMVQINGKSYPISGLTAVS